MAASSSEAPSSDSDDSSVDLLAPVPVPTPKSTKRDACMKQDDDSSAVKKSAKRLKPNDASASDTGTNKKQPVEAADLKDDTATRRKQLTMYDVIVKKAPTTSSSREKDVSTTKQPAESNASPLAQEAASIRTNKSAVMTPASASDDVPPVSTKIPDAIIPQLAKTPSNVGWSVYRNAVLVRKDHRVKEKRTKAAAFDLDGTLLLWRCTGWPSKPEHYELWSTQVVEKMQRYHDDGYQLVLFTNQGGIRSAFGGKNATRVKGLIDWLANKVDRPIFAIVSTSTKSGYHKPSAKMWSVVVEVCNGGVELDLSQSFYVGDSDGSGSNNDKYQDLGIDKEFAENVGKLYDTTLKFETPVECFGESDSNRRKEVALAGKQLEYEEPPKEALRTLVALQGGYLHGPILLILCGAQGSGKSYFCNELVRDNSLHWVHLSQDTINNGKPGKREKVEEAALEALQNDKSAVIDRMHLDPDQRRYFLDVAKDAGVPAHALWLNPPQSIIEQRVRDRTNHPGKVQGKDGAKLATVSLQKLEKPTYKEGLNLISAISSESEMQAICERYRKVGSKEARVPKSTSLPREFVLNDTKLPSLALGTMKLGKRKASSVVSSSGFLAVDTAPTYNNETEVGNGLSKGCFVTVKIPKRATQPSEVRSEFESSLQKLQLKKVDLALLHWPCDFIEAGTLQAAWKELEGLVQEGKICALGVCNFSVDALRLLLPLCCTVRPSVNQVERHPLLPQWELLDFCRNRGIVLQAHTALGQGREELLQHPTVLKVAQTTNLTPAQVVLSWDLQQSVAVVTKCSDEEHQKDVLQVLDKSKLDPDEIQKLDSISLSNPMRFVAPPFMYKRGAPYSWGDHAPKKP